MRFTSDRRGVTLIELLVVIVIVSGVVATTYSLFQSQSQSFRKNTDRFDLAQNARGAIELSERVIRTMGAGVTGQQPVLVYGAGNVIAFNADYVERDTVDMRWAAYWNPDVAVAQTIAWKTADATPIPNSSPAYTYPTVDYTLGNGTPSPAETYMLYFTADTDTPRSDDYVLWQRVNNGTPELLARGILAATGSKPFFEYLLERQLATGDTLFVASGGLLPLIRKPLSAAASAADTASFSRPDSVRAVRMNYRITNGKSGADERIRDISTVIEVPNNGVPLASVCGRPPLAPGALSVTEVGVGLGEAEVTWSRSSDQDAGEVDVRQYVIWRRPSSEATFDAPLLYVRSERDTVTYTSIINDNTPGETYIFGVAAQDCTPAFSSVVTTNITFSVP